MPRFIVRTEAPAEVHDAIEAVLEDHPLGRPGRVERHSRRTVIHAEDAEAATRIVEKRELRIALGEAEGDDLPLHKAILNVTTKPYVVTSVVEG